MKKYNKPAIEICSFDVKDIITISGQDKYTTSGLTGADKEAYNNYAASGSIAATNVTIFKW